MIRAAIPGALRLAAMGLLGFALFPPLSAAQAVLDAERDGAAIRIGVEAVWCDLPAEYTSIAVQRWTVGLCNDMITVTPTPWPREVRPSYDPISSYFFSEPMPGDNRCYGYVVRAVDAEGQLHAICGAGGMPFDYVSCGNAIVTRGHIVPRWPQASDTQVYFESCTEACWPSDSPIELELVDPATYTPYLFNSVVLDIYGYIEVSDMLPNVQIIATQVVLTTAGECGPLPVQSMGWGQVKKIYR